MQIPSQSSGDGRPSDLSSRHQIYDKIFRENIEPVIGPLLRHMTGLQLKETEELTGELPRTLERRPDFVRKVLSQEQHADFPTGPYILHIEFQTRDDPEMLYRMQEYHALLSRKYKLEVRQYVIYTGEKPSRMQTELSYGKWRFGYELLAVGEIAYQKFLSGDTAEEVLMSVLGDFGGEPAGMVTEKIISRLLSMHRDGPVREKYIRHLEIISKLRNLQSLIIAKITDMAFTYELEDDVRYRQGLEKGLEKGLEEGLERGLEKGLERGSALHQRQVIEKMITKGADNQLIFEYTDAPLALIQQIRQELSAGK